jgi:uncharacterized membrane protein YbhN (UPF0104 family)
LILSRAQIPGWTIRAAQVAVALALMALLWRAADGPEAARALSRASPFWLLMAFFALTAQTVLSALRWQLAARQLGIQFGADHAIREYYLAQIVNQSLPGGMIGDAGRAVRAREQAGLLASGQAVVFERLAGQVAMFCTLAVAFLGTFLAPGGLQWPNWLAIPVLGFLMGGFALPFVMLGMTRLPGGIGRRSHGLWRAIERALIAPSVLPWHILLSIGTTVCNLAAFAFCLQAVDIWLEISTIAALVPLILFTMLIPISISGWGLREGAAAALLPIAGASASGGLAASVAFGLVFIAAVLPGLLVWLFPAGVRFNR